jgi:uncharacterized membrane protein YhhN
MKTKLYLVLFLSALVANLLGIQLNNESVQFLSKPLIIAALAGYFIFSTVDIISKLKKWIILALFFSWAGDVLLMFQPKDELFFLLGLASFLIAHIFYIIYFHHVRVNENVKGNPWLLVAVVIYYAVLINLLIPYLGAMKIPVLVYGVVISFMLMLAMHMLLIKQKIAGRWMMTGALLFVISDSILAINKFYHPFPAAGILIMITYGLAQLFIVQGAIKYLRQHSKPLAGGNN